MKKVTLTTFMSIRRRTPVYAIDAQLQIRLRRAGYSIPVVDFTSRPSKIFLLVPYYPDASVFVSWLRSFGLISSADEVIMITDF